MKALKAALEELSTPDPYAELEKSVAELEELATYAENNSTDFAGVSMESVFKSFREPNHLEFGYAQKASVAVENLSAGAWAAIVAIAAAVIVALKKFFDWAFGGTSGSTSSGSGSSGGQLTGTVHKIETNKPLLKLQGEQLKDLADAIKVSEVSFEDFLAAGKHVATEDATNTTMMLAQAGNRKYIESMEDVLALAIKDEREVNPAWNFVMKQRDGFSEDILNNGPYARMVSDIIAMVQNGQFSQQRSNALQVELDRLMKDGDKTSEEDFNKFNEKLGDTDSIHVSGLGSKFKTVSELVHGSKEEHARLIKEIVEGRTSMIEIHNKLERQIEGATFSHMRQSTETLKHTVSDSEKHYESFKIEADVAAHNSAKAEREGDHQSGKHNAVATTMRHMAQYSKNLCELARVLFVYAKSLLKIMEYLRNASSMALHLLLHGVLPKVKNPDSKERITNLGREMKKTLAAYSL